MYFNLLKYIYQNFQNVYAEQLHANSVLIIAK